MNLTDIFQMNSISSPKGVAGPLPAMSGAVSEQIGLNGAGSVLSVVG